MNKPIHQIVTNPVPSLQTRCGACSEIVLTPLDNPHATTQCARCGAVSDVLLFPALWSDSTQNSGNTLPVFGDETSCYYHPSNQAVVPCDQCGRFLCALCDVEMHRRHVCPDCLHKNIDSDRIETLVTRRTRWDSIALYLTFLPMLLFYFTLFTAPVALFVAIRYWKAPGSLVSRYRWRMPVAAAVSSLQIVAWVVGFVIVLGSIWENA